MIEREIMFDQLFPAARYQRIAPLLNVDALLTDRPNEPVTRRFPIKHLSGIERDRQIEIGRGYFDELPGTC